MRILILDPCYQEFLYSFYARHPSLEHRSYAEQWRALMDECLGTADFYSTNLTALGHEATEIILNCEPGQRQWATEHGVKLDESTWTLVRHRGWIPWPRRIQLNDWLYAVLRAQVRHYRPDVLYVHDMNNINSSFLHEIRPYVKLI